MTRSDQSSYPAVLRFDWMRVTDAMGHECGREVRHGNEGRDENTAKNTMEEWKMSGSFDDLGSIIACQ